MSEYYILNFCFSIYIVFGLICVFIYLKDGNRQVVIIIYCLVFKKLYLVLIKFFCVFICIRLENFILNIIVWYLINGVQFLMSFVCIYVVIWIVWVLCIFYFFVWYIGVCIVVVFVSKGDFNFVYLF